MNAIQQPLKERKIFFPNLDGLRTIAFLMVFIWHALKAPFDMLAIDNPLLQKFFYFFLNGKTGVSIFFVLSGFLITYLMLAEIRLNGKVNIPRFYLRRSLRIWPLYFLILFLLFGVAPLVMQLLNFNWNEFDMKPAYYFLFLSNFDVLNIYLAHGTDLLPATVTWSVAIEEQFYLIWPLLFSCTPTRFYKFVFPALLVVSYTYRALYANSSAVLNFHTLSVCGDLALGGWVAYLSFTKKGFVDFFIAQSKRFRFCVYFFSLIALYLTQFIDNDFMNSFGRLFQTIFFAYIILDQNFSKGTSFKFSNSRFLTFWGRYTYGLYLWHPLVLMTITLLLTKLFHFSLQNISTYLIVAASGFVGSMAISYFSYEFFESYFLRMKNKLAFVKAQAPVKFFEMLKQQ
ncbi:MAG: acyltransferase [Ferruginibacter sp.]